MKSSKPSQHDDRTVPRSRSLKMILTTFLTLTLIAAQASAYLADNGDFSLDLNGWNQVDGSWSHNAGVGSHASLLGSAETTGTDVSTLTRCLDISELAAGTELTVTSWVRKQSHISESSVTVSYHSGAGCLPGNLLASETDSETFVADVWFAMFAPSVVPAAAQTALITLSVDHGGALRTTWFDTVSLRHDWVANGDFSSGLMFWNPVTGAGDGSSWTAVVDEVTGSMSAEGVVGSTNTLQLATCMQMDDLPATPLLFWGIRVRSIDSLPAPTRDYHVGWVYRDDDANCDENVLGGLDFDLSLQFPLATDGSWQPFGTFILPPQGTNSIVFYFDAGGSDPGVEVRIDDIVLTVSDFIFASGFETGDLTLWSSTSP